MYINSKSMKTTNYSELRNNMKDYFDAVIADCEPLIVHRSGKESVVVISLDEYNAIKETEYLTSSPAMVERIKQAEKDIAEGKGRKIKPEDVWK